LPTNFCIIGDTPHDWLFPRTSLVIHHGGSGTTHSAARAGVPSVVLPFAADQFFWAEQLRQRSIAPATGSVHNVTGRHLLVQSSPLERQRCGSRLLPSAKKCARKTAWQRLSGEFML
jgi:hypothetical protein